MRRIMNIMIQGFQQIERRYVAPKINPRRDEPKQDKIGRIRIDAEMDEPVYQRTTKRL
jgi:hypothetical protein